uniref:WYL domain-containing protein n=1 Tax=Rheinheimera sp. TaxID=1869214 RepID=UPI004047F106
MDRQPANGPSNGRPVFTLLDRFWHETQALTPLPDGSLELTLQLNDLLEVQRLILQWGGLAEALEPPELRDRLAAAGQALNRAHVVGVTKTEPLRELVWESRKDPDHER